MKPKYELLTVIIAIVIVVAYIVAVGNSNLPDWAKFFLLH